jgi:hypothetical protein
MKKKFQRKKKNTLQQRIIKKMENFLSGHCIIVVIVLLATTLILLAYFDHLYKKKNRVPVMESHQENNQSKRILELINRAISEQNPIDLYFMSKLYRYYEKNSSASLFYNFQSFFNTNDLESAIEVLEEVVIVYLEMCCYCFRCMVKYLMKTS